MRRFVRLAIVATILVLGAAVAAVLIPPSTDIVSGNVVVVHAGGRGERLQTGQALVQTGAAPILVIMNGTAEDWPEANAICGQAEPFLVMCPDSDIENTVGEVRELADLAVENSWRSAVVVTSDYHLRRTTILHGRCSDGVEIRPVAAEADISTTRRVLLVIREVLALPQAYTTGCG